MLVSTYYDQIAYGTLASGSAGGGSCPPGGLVKKNFVT